MANDMMTRGMDLLPADRHEKLEPKANRRKRRVVHVGKFYPPHMGGIETHLEALCGELRKSLELQVIVASDTRSTVQETLDGVPVLRVPTWLTLASTPLCPRMISEIRAYQNDIVHLHLPNPMAVMAYLVAGHRGPLVVSYHSDTVRQKVLGPMFEPLLHAALRRCSAIIAATPNYVRTSSVLAHYQSRCHVIPYGIPIEKFEQCSPAAVRSIRQEYGDRLIVSVGRLVYYKGFEHLIRAMPGVDGRLLIIGEGPLLGSLTALAAEVGVADRVSFLGQADHEKLVACFHAAKVFVLASTVRSEAFGIVQVEAMAAGLPVVNTKLDSGVPFVSLHNETGLTVPPADPGAIAEAVNLLLDNEDMRATFSQAAIVRARQEFSLNTMVSRMLSLYEGLDTDESRLSVQ